MARQLATCRGVKVIQVIETYDVLPGKIMIRRKIGNSILPVVAALK
jgi:hypothetical protein